MAGQRGWELKDSWTSFTLSNDESAFYVIYSHYFHYLNFIGSKRNFRDDKIKDAISDVFLYLLENRETLQSINNHHNYIITSFLRKLYRKSNMIFDDIPELEELPGWLVSPSVEDAYIQKDLNETVTELIKEKLDQLADKQRQLIYQKFYLGLSYHEIAERNNISVNTVYNTIYKATAKLQSFLTKEQETFLALAISLASIIILSFFQIQ